MSSLLFARAPRSKAKSHRYAERIRELRAEVAADDLARIQTKQARKTERSNEFHRTGEVHG